MEDRCDELWVVLNEMRHMNTMMNYEEIMRTGMKLWVTDFTDRCDEL